MPSRSWPTYWHSLVETLSEAVAPPVGYGMALRLLTLTVIVLVWYVRSRLSMKTWWHSVRSVVGRKQSKVAG